MFQATIEGKYRYLLTSRVSDSLRKLAVIQINPSLANEKRRDPTVGKVCKWACDHGYGMVYFLNFFAIIGPKQEDIESTEFDLLVGEKNDSFISEIPETADIVIATGKPKGALALHYERRKDQVLGILQGRDLYCVGDLTKDGYPRHGRMWNQANRKLRKLAWSHDLKESNP